MFEHHEHRVFMTENQGVMRWAVRRTDFEGEDPDPAVYVSSTEDESTWLEESPSFSEFTVELFLYNLERLGTEFTASAYLQAPRQLIKLASQYPRIELPQRNWPPSRYHGDWDLIIGFQNDGDGGWVYVSARNAEAAMELCSRFGEIERDSKSGDWPA
ncbi:MAG: hypothetical protein CMO80_11450 [Verrucomicrobiales bacterium]|nr:hypothetical protein [Verrucomicrobiales bacterium]